MHKYIHLTSEHNNLAEKPKVISEVAYIYSCDQKIEKYILLLQLEE